MKPEIKLIGLQVKSLKHFRRLAKHLTRIEEECGIKETRITLEGCFICPRIEYNNINTPMEKLLKGIIDKL